jgi:hypothetical protein
VTWTAPRTFVTGEVETAAIFNTHLRDNLLALQPQSASVATSQTTASTTYVDLTTVGPSVTMNTGTSVMITLSCTTWPSIAGGFGYMSVAVSGATTLAAADGNGILATHSSALYAQTPSRTFLLAGLTGGSNTFTAKYRTGGSSTQNFGPRDITVTPCF